MNQKSKIIITAAITAAVTFSVTSVLYFTIGALSRNNGSNKLANKINAVNTYLDRNYLYDDVDYEKLNDEAIKAYVDALDEPYTHYYTESEFSNYLSSVEESYTGIGVVIAADMEEDKILVLSPFVDSPAYDAGILPGDYIVAVDGISYTADEMQECVDRIKGGKEGTLVSLELLRNGETIKIDVKRGRITENSVTSEMLDEDIGYISITGFNMSTGFNQESTYTEFVDKVDELNEKGMKKLVIDLRDNPGGVMEEVINIADYILPEGLITYTETRNGKRNEYVSDKKFLDIPIVILINNNSASASEILTGALKDHDYAMVVGEKTFGKGIVQSVYPFTDGSGMSMTIAKYYTPDGISIHGTGIEPDYEVKLPEEFNGMYANSVPKEKDTQLQKAIELLK